MIYRVNCHNLNWSATWSGLEYNFLTLRVPGSPEERGNLVTVKCPQINFGVVYDFLSECESKRQ